MDTKTNFVEGMMGLTGSDFAQILADNPYELDTARDMDFHGIKHLVVLPVVLESIEEHTSTSPSGTKSTRNWKEYHVPNCSDAMTLYLTDKPSKIERAEINSTLERAVSSFPDPTSFFIMRLGVYREYMGRLVCIENDIYLPNKGFSQKGIEFSYDDTVMRHYSFNPWNLGLIRAYVKSEQNVPVTVGKPCLPSGMMIHRSGSDCLADQGQENRTYSTLHHALYSLRHAEDVKVCDICI